MPTDPYAHFVALLVAWSVGLAAIAGGMRAAWWIATRLLTGAKNLEFFVNMFPTFRVIAKEFQPNGGGSLKDQVADIANSVKRLEDGHVELHKGQEAAVLTANEAKDAAADSVKILREQNVVLDTIESKVDRGARQGNYVVDALIQGEMFTREAYDAAMKEPAKQSRGDRAK